MREPTTFTINDGERPVKVRITPMDAVRAERWLTRALFVAGPAIAAIKTNDKPDADTILETLNSIDYEKVVPLWDELLSCCQFVVNDVAFDVTPETLTGKIEYPTTLIAIKAAALKANFGFFGSGGLLKFLGVMRGALTSTK